MFQGPSGTSLVSSRSKRLHLEFEFQLFKNINSFEHLTRIKKQYLITYFNRSEKILKANTGYTAVSETWLLILGRPVVFLSDQRPDDKDNRELVQ